MLRFAIEYHGDVTLYCVNGGFCSELRFIESLAQATAYLPQPAFEVKLTRSGTRKLKWTFEKPAGK